jgi:hypothetical protein
LHDLAGGDVRHQLEEVPHLDHGLFEVAGEVRGVLVVLALGLVELDAEIPELVGLSVRCRR